MIQIKLHNRGLTGTIPRALGSLANLYNLGISYNQLSGTVPSSLGSLSKLTTLRISNNSFYGTVPSSFASLVNLKSLTIDSWWIAADPVECSAECNVGAGAVICSGGSNGATTRQNNCDTRTKPEPKQCPATIACNSNPELFGTSIGASVGFIVLLIVLAVGIPIALRRGKSPEQTDENSAQSELQYEGDCAQDEELQD